MNKNILAILTAGALVFSVGSFAATQGDLTFGGPTSGDIDITVEKGESIEISNLADIDFNDGGVNLGSNATATDLTKITNACVHSTSGNYKVAVKSTKGVGVDFLLADATDDTATVKYTVEWKGTPLTNDITSFESFTGADQSATCAADNTEIKVAIDVTQFQSAAAGTYSDTLNVTLEAE